MHQKNCPIELVILILLCLVLIPNCCLGTVTLKLKNGNPMEGKLISVENGKITFETGGMQLTLPMERIISPETDWMQEAENAMNQSNFTRAGELCQQILIWNPENIKAKNIQVQLKQEAAQQKQKQAEIKLAREQEVAQKKAEEQQPIEEKEDSLTRTRDEKAQQEAMPILQHVSDTFKNIKSYQIEGNQTIESWIQGTNNSSVISLAVAEVKPNKIKMSVTDSMQIISDGTISWLYNPRKKQYVKSPGHVKNLLRKIGSNINSDSFGISEYETINQNVKTVELLREEFIPFGKSSVNCYVVRLEKENENQNPEFNIPTRIYWFDKKTFIPIKQTETLGMKNRSGTVQNILILTSVKLNTPIPDDYFVFKPSPDLKDMTEEVESIARGERKVEGEKNIRIITCLDKKHSYAVYLPDNYKQTGKSFPVLFCFEPSGDGLAAVRNFRYAGEKYGWILVGSLDAKNGPWNPILQAQEAMLIDIDQRYNVDRRKFYAMGMSGGARMSYTIAYNHPDRFRGIIACGAGFGRGNINRNVGVYHCIGDQDSNLQEVQNAYSQLRSYNVNTQISVFSGGHVLPPSNIINQAIDWIASL